MRIWFSNTFPHLSRTLSRLFLFSNLHGIYYTYRSIGILRKVVPLNTTSGDCPTRTNVPTIGSDTEQLDEEQYGEGGADPLKCFFTCRISNTVCRERQFATNGLVIDIHMKFDRSKSPRKFFSQYDLGFCREACVSTKEREQGEI